MQVIAAAFSAEVDGFAADPKVFLLFAAHGHFIYFAAVNAAQARLRAVKALVTGDAYFLPFAPPFAALRQCRRYSFLQSQYSRPL